MANVTFTSPAIKKDLTVYAIAGDRRTLLSLAKDHNVPLHHECENGECGSCAIEVTVLTNKQPLGEHLTEKEKIVLRLAGKVTKEQIDDAELRDVPPPWRLACQYIIGNEDILVRF
jgi:ferredoxin